MFTKGKFSSLKPTQAHKKCAELLQMSFSSKSETLLSHYNDLASWLNLAPVSFSDPKVLLDRLFLHTQEASLSRQEYALNVTKCDRENALPFLPIAIYLENLRSCHNIGSIIRTTEAFRLGSISYSGTMPSLEKLKKSAMGCQEWVSYKPATLETLPRPLIALETAPLSIPYHAFSFPKSFTLALGNEEYGLSDALLKQADAIIHIPLFGRKNSLNVATAFAIIAAEIRKNNS